MNRTLGAGWGILIYATMYLAWAGLSVYGVYGVSARAIALIVLIVISGIAGESLRYSSWRDVLPFSFLWMVEVIVLDMIYTVPAVGWLLFADWNVWVGYALVFAVPLVIAGAHKRAA